jgi:AraC-like DNA-binding protein
MTDPIERAVERAITTIRTNLAEDITIDDLARAALFSKFHFTRVFRRITGVSPGRFLAAERLQEAKRLLSTTSFSIADISRRVGYQSVGTFSTRFTRSVGMSPTSYRRLGGGRPDLMAKPEPAVAAQFGSAYGHISDPRDQPTRIYLGLFPNPIPDVAPVRCTTLNRSGAFLLERIPVGTYYLLCHATDARDPADRDPEDRDPADRDPEYRGAAGRDAGRGDAQRLAVACSGPVTVRPDQMTTDIDLRLKPLRPLDPPILLATAAPR